MIKEVLQQLEPLDAQIDALCSSTDDAEMANTTTHAAELAELSAQENMLLQRCTSLTPEDRVFLARRPDRPHIGEIIDNLFTDFFEQCGDRQCKEDAAILCGIARFHGMPVTVLGHRKGTTLEENLRCNFGMPGPEGYRKAQRLMDMADKFNMPVLAFVDTAGAYPGVEAEARGQAEAIAATIQKCLRIRVPLVSVIIGEGGSGGAIAIATANRILMLENSIYSVISPEGCASILWRSADKVKEATEALRLTAQDLKHFGVIDEIVREPVGGAHRDPQTTISRVGDALLRNLKELLPLSGEELKKQRTEKFLAMGRNLPE